jgi:hypothetical protein
MDSDEIRGSQRDVYQRLLLISRSSVTLPPCAGEPDHATGPVETTLEKPKGKRRRQKRGTSQPWQITEKGREEEASAADPGSPAHLIAARAAVSLTPHFMSLPRLPPAGSRGTAMAHVEFTDRNQNRNSRGLAPERVQLGSLLQKVLRL